ncbi:unnamed protein product [Zymoseptoria tritici ST99CH_1E4]|uniref:Zn(2)-C6 fungal-type domain-containing protein n=1 Tax=Zymoseptoria tritici ST99CH_1E4 TaxID=1276532 RepID=A0A2H1H4R6_ZYMTR|nr:unnamed protein product [Zymoseptoria tritici ST99CH_1E4]
MAPRPIRPKDEPTGNDDNAADSKGGKRRAVSSACIPCRKRKSKCDGGVPSCSTCIAVYRTECSYDADSDHRRKGALKRDIQSLTAQNDSLEVILASLRSLPEGEAFSLLRSLRADTDPDAIANALRSEVRLPHNFAQQTLEADFVQGSATPSTSTHADDSFGAAISRTHSGESQYYAPSQLSVTSAPVDKSQEWFNSPEDPEFVDHLLNLYYCWLYPFHSFVCWETFNKDRLHGGTDFCSSALMYAILAIGCHYSDRPQARTDPNNPSTAGDIYFAEAKRIVNNADKPHLTTVQALGIMSLREGSAGRDSLAYQYAGRSVRMALEMGLHLSVLKENMRTVDAQVRKIAFWAVFNLETICAVSLGRVSQLPRSAADIDTPSINARSETQSWKPYEDNDISNYSSAEQPARTLLFKDQMSKLSQLASDMVNTFYAPREQFTSRSLAAAYAQYQSWYQSLPEVFWLQNTTLPHVLVLHIYYYACVLHLFRPYIKLDLRAANLYPLDTCTLCANEISAILGALRAMYGLRRVTSPVTSFVLSACTIHLLNLPSDTAAANLTQGLHDLEALSVNHPFAARAIDIIRSLSSKWNITLPEGAAAVANYRGTSIRKSPIQTSFFAASIPRKQSSEGRKRSAASSNSQTKESPFAPPSSHPQQQLPQHPQQHHDLKYPPQTSSTAVFSDPSAPLDPRSGNFWTPFPTQVMPNPHLDDSSTNFDFTRFGGQPHQWQSYGVMPSQQQHVQGYRPGPPSGPMDETMSGAEQWHWE